jgi:hypothetical protein
MPTKLLLWVFVIAFIWYLLFGVSRGIKPIRNARLRYWIGLGAFVLLMLLLVRLI